MVKWTGEGFKLMGKLLTNETVEEWLENHGKELAERILKEMTVKWFFGNARSRRQAKKEVLSGVNSSTPLRMALNDSINKLPSVIRHLALAVEKEQITVLIHKGNAFEKLVVVPRAMVVDGFTRTLLEDLGNAAELKRFQDLPDLFLRKQASQAERVLCDRLLRDGEWALVGKNGIIVRADDQFEWQRKNIPGHYYFGDGGMYSRDLTKKLERRKFLAQLKPWVDAKMVELGKLTTADLDKTAACF